MKSNKRKKLKIYANKQNRIFKIYSNNMTKNSWLINILKKLL